MTKLHASLSSILFGLMLNAYHVARLAGLDHEGALKAAPFTVGVLMHIPIGLLAAHPAVRALPLLARAAIGTAVGLGSTVTLVVAYAEAVDRFDAFHADLDAAGQQPVEPGDIEFIDADGNVIN